MGTFAGTDVVAILGWHGETAYTAPARAWDTMTLLTASTRLPPSTTLLRDEPLRDLSIILLSIV